MAADIVVYDFDNPGEPELLPEGLGVTRLMDWHPTEPVVAVVVQATQEVPGGTGFLQASGGTWADWAPAFVGNMASFSPDGSMIAHNSRQSGVTHVSVHSYPDARFLGQVSVDYGTEARWCAACEAPSTLFFRRRNQIFETVVARDGQFDPGTPEVAFETAGFIDTGGLSYDVTADGGRMLVVKRTRNLPRLTINVIQNWARGSETGSGGRQP